jgi:hypothetical protein
MGDDIVQVFLANFDMESLGYPSKSNIESSARIPHLRFRLNLGVTFMWNGSRSHTFLAE